MIASAPGKLLLAGEYAVLDGAPAVLVAVNRRAVARVLEPGARPPRSPFLTAVAAQLTARYGAGSDAARTAVRIAVDSSAFYADDDQKLGLGSSAAVTVAATALALAASRRGTPTAEILELALAAHAAAQGARGARGSGADVATAVHGGTIIFWSATAVRPVVWPDAVRVLPFFTGASADTATLVQRIAAARADAPTRDATDAALTAIDAASRALAAALAGPRDLTATATLAALRLAAAATDQLARASAVPLVPPAVHAVRAALAPLGGTAKTTGAGGGDVAIAVIPATADATAVAAAVIQAGCTPLPLAIDPGGVVTAVDTRPPAS